LIPQIVYHAVNLFNHRFREDLHLNPDFNRRNRAAGNEVATVRYRRLARDDLAEGPVPTPGRYAAPFVLDVQNAILPIDRRVDQFGRAIDGDKVFVEVHCHKVTLTGIAMLVNLAFKEAPELRR
jgi:hypothetical protein